jgi:hypothetical protein
MPDAVLDDPGFPAARERFWTAALTDERYRENRAAVAERNGELVGIAMSGPPLDAAATWARQLYVLYVPAADHGAAGSTSVVRSRPACGAAQRFHQRSAKVAPTGLVHARACVDLGGDPGWRQSPVARGHGGRKVNNAPRAC